MGLCALSRWREGCRYESKARFELGIRPHLGTDHLTSSPKIRVGGRLEKQNSLYILIGSGGESVSQSPLKDQAFSTFLALQLLCWEMSESMGNHDSNVVGAGRVC